MNMLLSAHMVNTSEPLSGNFMLFSIFLTIFTFCMSIFQRQRIKRVYPSKLEWLPTPTGAARGENWSLCQGSAGPDPGHNQTCKCEIWLKAKQLIKLQYKGNIISPPLYIFFSFDPSLFSFLCINLLRCAVFTTSYSG